MKKKIEVAKSKFVYDEQSHSNNHFARRSYLNSVPNLPSNNAVSENEKKTTPVVKNQTFNLFKQKASEVESNSDSYLLRKNSYFIREISSFKQRLKVNSLIKRMYASRGYVTDHTTVFSMDKDQITFEACDENGQLGTLTLIIDLGKGLLADQHYQEEIDAFRGQENRVCEVSKLAFNPSSSSKEIFASLFHIAYLYAYCLYGVKNAFIEINPRHASFYKRMLGFEQIGEERVCTRVDAPAVLLRLNLEYMRENILKNQTTPNISDRSIYGYFLSQSEAQDILTIIQNQLGHQIKLEKAESIALNTENTSTLLYNLFTEAIKDGSANQLEKLVYC